MARIDEAISQAWSEAAIELGIRATTPFTVKVDGDEIVTEAYVADFGGPNGTVVLSRATSTHYEVLKRLNYFVPILFPTYREYA